VNVFDALWEAGQDLGVRLAGYFALDSLRSEKGFRHLGHDIGPVDDPTSAGLRFTLGRAKPDGFTGQDAALAVDPASPPHRTVYIAVDDPEPLLLHDETVFCDGEPAGRCTSGSYGHTLRRAVGLATIGSGVPLDGKFTVECKGQQHALTVSRRPFYDPAGSRMKQA
jgi:4-methylaminobutanoate oxidase (formaldehyde-forming)